MIEGLPLLCYMKHEDFKHCLLSISLVFVVTKDLD